MRRVFRILKDGTVEGLWGDVLAGLGEASVTRASKVEFIESIGRWSVEILIGPSKGYVLPDTYERRKDALEAEVKFLNEQLAAGLI